MTTLVQDAPVQARFAPARSAWRNLIVHVQPEATARPRLEAAADLARKLDAQLLGVAAEAMPPLAMTDASGMLGGEFVSVVLDAINTNLRAAQTAFTAQTKSLDSAWLGVQERPAGAIARLSRSADLVIAGGAPLNQRDEYRACDTAELTLHCGRPVLVVPPQGGKLNAKRVVVAWKDTREARRALADSLPILKCADEVLVVAICPAGEVEDVQVHTSAVIGYLMRHGVHAQAKVLAQGHTAPSLEIQAQASRLGADLIVAGAYGHTRLGEWVFGGVTLELLEDPQRFLLLSH